MTGDEDRDGLLKSTARTPARAASGGTAYRLVVLYGPKEESRGIARVCGRGRIEIGRASTGPGAFVLPDSELSRAHAAVEPSAAGYQVVDLGSRNGTFVNGARVEREELRPGSVIRVGSHVLLFEAIELDMVDALTGARRHAASPLLGDSVQLCALLGRIEALAQLDAPVLILGESGVGKELVAAELHRLSRRHAARFVAVNCAAIPEQVAESELFGHARGAFTGAAQQSHGLFGEADGGTLFLDEIGEMPLPLQAKLLRALESGEVRGVGETRSRTVQTRVLAATNVALEAAVQEGRFRGDLLARLDGAAIHVPPLRARRVDVLPLAAMFRARMSKRSERAPCGEQAFTPDAAEAMAVYGWPWSVRELKRAIDGARALVADDEPLDVVHLPRAVWAGTSERWSAQMDPGVSARLPIALAVRPDAVPSADDLRAVAEHFGGNVSQIAAFFGKERRQVYRWAERDGLDLEAIRGAADQ